VQRGTDQVLELTDLQLSARARMTSEVTNLPDVTICVVHIDMEANQQVDNAEPTLPAGLQGILQLNLRHT
jgi:hypothetical protein